MNQQLADMLIDQIIQSRASSVEIGTRGHKRSFDVSKLKGEFEVVFQYFVTSPTIDAARFSLAGVAERYLDEETILKDDDKVEFLYFMGGGCGIN